MLCDDISQTIERTPVVRINRPAPALLDIAARATEGSVILAMLPDTGERCLSTTLFEGVETGSDAV